jgi:hypothetical protein
MHKSNKTCAEILTEEMIELAMLTIKYSPSQLTAMIFAIDLDNLQYEMEHNGATEDELRASSECHHDIHELMQIFEYGR